VSELRYTTIPVEMLKNLIRFGQFGGRRRIEALMLVTVLAVIGLSQTMPVEAITPNPPPGGITWAMSEHISNSTDAPFHVAVDASGVYVSGNDQNTVGNKMEWRVEKRSLTTGVVIWGRSEHLSSNSDDLADGIAVDTSGVYVVGSDANIGNGTTREWRVEKRSLTTGNLIWAQSEHISNGTDAAADVAVDASGIYVAGIDQNTVGNEMEWRVEKRNLSTGSVIWAQSEHISTLDIAQGVAVDASGVYVVGYDSTPGMNLYEWRVERRSKPQADPLSAAGMGRVVFTVNNGSFLGSTTLNLSEVSPSPPTNLVFPYGLFNCTIGNLTLGASVNMTMIVPTALPSGTSLTYWTFHSGTWQELPASHVAVSTNRTVLVMNLTDGVASDDEDGIQNGVIVDVGGVAYMYVAPIFTGWKYSGNPILTGTPGGWDQYVWMPRVLYDGNTFRMWYQGNNSTQPGEVGYATSEDGKAWTKYTDPILRPGPSSSWDNFTVSPGRVVWNGTCYLMWYVGGWNNSLVPQGSRGSRDIGLAFSNDGAVWTKYAGNPVLTPSLGSTYLGYPYVLRFGNTYKMWYSERPQGGNTYVYYATSQDGIHWTKRTSPVFSSQYVRYSPSVIFAGGKYLMFYSEAANSYPYINYATSDDGISWTIGSGNPILISGQQSDWDNADVDNQDAVAFQDTIMLYYSGAHCASTDCNTNPNDYDGYNIGLAMAPAGWLAGVTGVSYVAAIPLASGWNLVSTPVVPSNAAIVSVLGSFASNEVTVVWGYVGTGSTRSWASYRPGSGGALTTINDGNGYWIYMRYPDTLFVGGNIIPPASTPPSYPLSAGWNLIGFKPQPTVANETVGAYLSSIAGKYDSSNVWILDNSSGNWIRAQDSTWLVPGQAMWILMTAPGTLRP
jgi:predicted GH43/DUF377 family glycosyl hydrolase